MADGVGGPASRDKWPGGLQQQNSPETRLRARESVASRGVALKLLKTVNAFRLSAKIHRLASRRDTAGTMWNEIRYRARGKKSRPRSSVCLTSVKRTPHGMLARSQHPSFWLYYLEECDALPRMLVSCRIFADSVTAARIPHSYFLNNAVCPCAGSLENIPDFLP